MTKKNKSFYFIFSYIFIFILIIRISSSSLYVVVNGLYECHCFPIIVLSRYGRASTLRMLLIVLFYNFFTLKPRAWRNFILHGDNLACWRCRGDFFTPNDWRCLLEFESLLNPSFLYSEFTSKIPPLLWLYTNMMVFVFMFFMRLFW